MPNYAYTIRDATGSVIPGTSEAENEDILRRRLTEQGFSVVEVKQIKSTQKKTKEALSMRISLITDECTHDPFTALELGKRWGINHFEIRYAHRWRVPEGPAWAADQVAAAVKAYGVTVTAISPGLFKPVMRTDGSKIPLTTETPAEIRRHLDELLPRFFDFAARLGTRNITVFALPKPAEAGGAPPAVVIDSLAEAAGKAASAGFTLLLENGQGSWADTGAASRAILEKVHSPALRMTWDPA
ncbi:MAG: TIM barrel protein, partial [Armatimonadota bacterium]